VLVTLEAGRVLSTIQVLEYMHQIPVGKSLRSLEHFRNRPTIRVNDISRLEFRGQVLRQEFG